MRDNEYLAEYRNIDFSAESVNMEKNLVILKEKLSKKPYRRLRPSLALVAVLITTLSLSVIAFGDQAWRYLQTRVIEGEEFVAEFFVREAADGSTVESGIIVGATPEAFSARIVVEVDGQKQVISDRRIFYDLDEALGHLALDNVLLPVYLPESLTFEKAVFLVCPIDNPQELGSKTLTLHYTGMHSVHNLPIDLHLMIMYYPLEWTESSIYAEELWPGRYSVNMFSGGVAYHLSSNYLGREELISFAEAMR